MNQCTLPLRKKAFLVKTIFSWRWSLVITEFHCYNHRIELGGRIYRKFEENI